MMSSPKSKGKKSGKNVKTFTKHLLHTKSAAKKKSKSCEFC